MMRICVSGVTLKKAFIGLVQTAAQVSIVAQIPLMFVRIVEQNKGNAMNIGIYPCKPVDRDLGVGLVIEDGECTLGFELCFFQVFISWSTDEDDKEVFGLYLSDYLQTHLAK